MIGDGLSDYPARTRAVRSVDIVFSKPRHAGCRTPGHYPHPMAVEMTGPIRQACPLGFLIQVYCVLSGVGAICDAATAPAGGWSRNLRMICGDSVEVSSGQEIQHQKPQEEFGRKV